MGGVLAVGLFALIAAGACVSTAPAQPSAASKLDTCTSSATSASMTPASEGDTACPETSARPRENVAALGHVRASANLDSAFLAIDGDTDQYWNAYHYPIQWFSISFDDLYLTERIQMVVSQAPAGPTTHELWLGNGSGTRTLYKRFTDVYTEDGQTLEVDIDPPAPINEVLLLTLRGPSWVAWREVRVLGKPTANLPEVEEEPFWKLNKISGGLEKPVHVTHAGDGSGRIFVVEHPGRIRIVKDGIVADTPFLDISDRVMCCGEVGLVGLAFPPTYADSQQFYVGYTNFDGATTVSRFAATGDPDRADPDSEEVLLTIGQPRDNHNGGHLAFGPKDGYLYIGSGDGGEIGVLVTTGQEPDSLLGKILRIDVESNVKPYSIPPGNPFSQSAGHRGEIWALGIRNPWGFAFDSETGDLYIPDVGETRLEEINYQPASSVGAENYGWSEMEGNRCFSSLDSGCNADGLTLPVAVYDHSQGCAIVGGAVYRGKMNAQLQGAFLYADFCSGRVWGLKRLGADSRESGQDACQSKLLLQAESAVPVSKIGQDEEGNLYAIGYIVGAIFEITEK